MMCLICPNCKGTYLRQRAVEVRERAREDSDGRIYRIEGLNLDSIAVKAENITSVWHRGTSTRIEFSCEGCLYYSVLCIWQEKRAGSGSPANETFFAWATGAALEFGYGA